MVKKYKAPPAHGTADGTPVRSLGSVPLTQTIASTSGNAIRPREPEELLFTARGRIRQILQLLIDRGEQGFMSDEVRGPGWGRRPSQYVFKLRRAGLLVATSRERASDGTIVARYTLLSIPNDAQG